MNIKVVMFPVMRYYKIRWGSNEVKVLKTGSLRPCKFNFFLNFDTCTVHSLLFVIQLTDAQIILNIVSI